MKCMEHSREHCDWPGHWRRSIRTNFAHTSINPFFWKLVQRNILGSGRRTKAGNIIAWHGPKRCLKKYKQCSPSASTVKLNAFFHAPVQNRAADDVSFRSRWWQGCRSGFPNRQLDTRLFFLALQTKIKIVINVVKASIKVFTFIICYCFNASKHASVGL